MVEVCYWEPTQAGGPSVVVGGDIGRPIVRGVSASLGDCCDGEWTEAALRAAGTVDRDVLQSRRMIEV